MSKQEFEIVKELAELETGDIVKGRASGNVYVVVVNYGTRVTAVNVADITNPNEWLVLREK